MLIPDGGMAQESCSARHDSCKRTQKSRLKKKRGKIKVKLTNSLRAWYDRERSIFEGIYTDDKQPNAAAQHSPCLLLRERIHIGFRNCILPGSIWGCTRFLRRYFTSTLNGLDVNANKSWEITFNLFHVPTLSRDRQWGITTGLGWGYVLPSGWQLRFQTNRWNHKHCSRDQMVKKLTAKAGYAISISVFR